MRVFVLCVGVALLNAACISTATAQTDQEIYAEVDRIFGEAEVAVSTNLEAFVKANEAPLSKARSAMSELIAQLNKDGRSQLAIALQKRLSNLEETVQKRASVKVPIIAAPQKPVLERVAGKWDRPGFKEHFLLEAQGVWRRVANDAAGTVLNTAPIKVVGANELEVRYDTGWRLVCRPASEDVLAVSEWNPDGNQTQGFVLQRAASDLNPIAPPAPQPVPRPEPKPWPAAKKGAVQFKGHWYKVFPDRLSWHQAKAKCEEFGGHLVIVDDAQEEAFIRTLAGKAGFAQAVWLGVTDQGHEGRWVWVDGKQRAYSNWGHLQPNNKDNEEHYAVLRVTEGDWMDLPSVFPQMAIGFICEWDE